MSEKFNNFCSELRTKINDADKRIKDLKANAAGASEKAKVEAKAQLCRAREQGEGAEGPHCGGRGKSEIMDRGKEDNDPRQDRAMEGAA